jgi:hypothetical protein
MPAVRHALFKMAASRLTRIDLELMDLNRLLKELVPEWFQFGIQLKIPIDELKKIESNMRPEDDNKFTDMLEKWLEYSTEVRSWDMISTGLECIGNRRLAIQIKHDYGSCNGKDKPLLRGVHDVMLCSG